MNKKRSLLPRMAANNIRKNGATYFPYIGVSIFTMFTYFVFDLIVKNRVMWTLPRADYAAALVQIGFVLLGIIMVPFLYYTNSFLIKRRKRELGLYSILGMEKKHIGIMMFWESLAAYVVVMAFAIPLGLLFSRLLFLLLLNLARLPVEAEFSVSPMAVTDTLLFYAFVSALNLFVNLVQVGKARPIELLSGSRKGEKAPRKKGLWVWSILGILALGTGYRLAVTAKLDSFIFTNFFLAVLLVVMGTWFLFTSGSVVVLQRLQKRKRYYYRADNFITVSGMLYRMKKNAAGLSNICIFSTMFIITVICTVSIWLSMDSITAYSYPRTLSVYWNGQQEEEAMKEKLERIAGDTGVELTDYLGWSGVTTQNAYQEGNKFRVMTEEERGNYYAHCTLHMMTLQEYNRMEQSSAELSEGEVLVFSRGTDFGHDELWVGENRWQVKEELSRCSMMLKGEDPSRRDVFLAVFATEEERSLAAAVFGMGSEQRTLEISCTPEGSEGAVDAFVEEVSVVMATDPLYEGCVDYRGSISGEESMYGGLMFIGIFFGSIFLICLLIIMYYKQITEGFEDQNNFEIMRKVGMSDEEIRKTIKKQVRLVFALPLAGAVLHTVVGMKMVVLLMGALHNYEVRLMMICTAAVCVTFALVYSICYRRTSAAYYRIVRQMER